MASLDPRRGLLLVGGGGGLVGRAVLDEFAPDFRIRSLHRSSVPREQSLGVEWQPADAGGVRDWDRYLDGIDVVLILAWYRSASRRRFVRLFEGLDRLVAAASRRRVGRILHMSVPAAPEELETRLPYLVYKRRLDQAIIRSGCSFRLVRPTMLFGPRDRLLGVMMRAMHRYPWFPMFGDGRYHVSPVSVDDLARILRQEADGNGTGELEVGGPVRYEYRELTELMFRLLGKRARYWRLSPRESVAFARALESLGSTMLYAYEVKWLLSDRLGLPPCARLDRPMRRVEPYLESEARRLLGRAA